VAWVGRQRFPAYAIIGPRSIGELRESAGALELELTADEAAWLDLVES
jgi:aryl-alcohol dehydrogenase-like predicted oxidoreductase